jgi:hypothetical protein
MPGNVTLAEKPSVPVPFRAPARPPTAPRREYMTPYAPRSTVRLSR